MSDEDARFEDGGEHPLYLGAQTPDDLQILSSLTQDAVLAVTDINWSPTARRFALLVNRFRWEDADNARKRQRAYERVRAVLAFDGVLAVRSQGVDRGDKDLILSLLSLTFTPGQDGAGQIELTLAGDGAIVLEVECLDATLRDVTRPYAAPSRKAPDHGDA